MILDIKIMRKRILDARKWFEKRPIIEKVIIHVGLFPLPFLFLFFTSRIKKR
tara:strand:+ start:1035 stop:1190 length:156 start_codon:yes stop_codon:yes gene_type:complete